MKLRVFIPTAVALEGEVRRVSAPGVTGRFVLLPRHRDYVAELGPGILETSGAAGPSQFYALDGGTLVKCGSEVRICTPRILGPARLGTLQEAVRQRFRVLDEGEKRVRTVLAKLEARLTRRLMELVLRERA